MELLRGGCFITSHHTRKITNFPAVIPPFYPFTLRDCPRSRSNSLPRSTRRRARLVRHRQSMRQRLLPRSLLRKQITNAQTLLEVPQGKREANFNELRQLDMNIESCEKELERMKSAP